MSTLETVTTTSSSLSTVEPLDDRGSAVRFETQCVVIPDLAYRSRRPRVVTKSYTLPLWKRRASSPCPISAPPEDVSEENQSHVVLRVPLPTLSLKPHSTARPLDHTPLPPCLVHRARPSGPSCAGTSSRTRASRQPSPSPSRPDIVTVPLRPCCTACQSITDAALVGGDAWPEHFSRAASRRRSVSADGTPRTITVAGSAASASYGTLALSINVDEIDKRRRSSGSPTSRETPSDDAKTEEGCGVPSTPRIPEEDEDEDEDENELFPLPSPKRTPSTSPAPSPAGSLSSLIVPQANQNCVTSPTPSSCSGDSAGLSSTKRHFLAPPPFSSSSSLSLPKPSESTTDLTLAEDPPRVPSPNLLSTLPSLSARSHLRSPSPHISCVPPTPTDPLSAKAPGSPSPKSMMVTAPIGLPSSPDLSQPSTSPRHSPTHVRFPWRTRRSVSTDVISSTPSSTTPLCSPSTSPTSLPCPNTKRSFSKSTSRHIISDMLRGVGAMGSGGIGSGI